MTALRGSLSAGLIGTDIPPVTHGRFSHPELGPLLLNGLSVRTPPCLAAFGWPLVVCSTRALAEKTTPHLDLLFVQTPVLFRDTRF